MTFDDSQDYVKVKQANLDKFNIKAETYRQRFRSKTILEDETAKELQARLKDLFRKWIIPEILTKDQICDKMVLEQFLGMLNTDLQVLVREHTPHSSAEAADLVETFVTARPSRRKYFLGPPQHDWRRPYQAAQQELENISTGKSGMIVVVWLSPPKAPIAPVLAPLQLEHLEALFVMVVVKKVTLGPIVQQRKCLILDCATYLALASTHIVLPLM